MPNYPEHEKLAFVKDEAQECGEFVRWLEAQGWSICEHNDSFNGEWVPVRFRLEEILARRFEIDLRKIEAEKSAMLREIRTANAALASA